MIPVVVGQIGAEKNKITRNERSCRVSHESLAASFKDQGDFAFRMKVPDTTEVSPMQMLASHGLTIRIQRWPLNDGFHDETAAEIQIGFSISTLMEAVSSNDEPKGNARGVVFTNHVMNVKRRL